MENIISKENLVIDAVAQDYLINIANHSMRNIINNLEKIYILGEPVDLDLCKRLCSNISFQLFDHYITFIKKGQLFEAIQVFYGIHDYGYSVIDILDYFFSFVKITELLTEEEKYMIIPFLCKYITIFHILHEDVIELSLFTNKIFMLINNI
jgi:DNA polymerase III gamma/tau subunit